MVDAVERGMDEAGIETAHLVGCSLGGYIALELAIRGRARTVVALAPAGGWAPGDESYRETLAFFTTMRELLLAAVPHAEAILSTPEGCRRATEFATVNYEHIPVDLLAHQMRGAALCTAAVPLIEYAEREGWNLDAAKVACPVRVVWGTEDRLLPWPGGGGPLPQRVAAAGRLGRPRRSRPRDPDGRPARGRAADPRLQLMSRRGPAAARAAPPAPRRPAATHPPGAAASR